MTNVQNKCWDCLCNLDAEDCVRAFTDYNGLQILDEEFMDFLIDEGYMQDMEYMSDDDE